MNSSTEAELLDNTTACNAAGLIGNDSVSGHCSLIGPYKETGKLWPTAIPRGKLRAASGPTFGGGTTQFRIIEKQKQFNFRAGSGPTLLL